MYISLLTIILHKKLIIKKLDELKGESYTYRALIKGNFPENQYPNDEKIELKVGTQIMFIRNDASSERRYYNGKLAKVTKLSERGIWVQIEGENKDYQLKLETWEHKKYSLDDDKKCGGKGARKLYSVSYLFGMGSYYTQVTGTYF